ncbi:MAG: RNA polymerase factor sigma-54 [Candidatus Accumulibacter sp.]|jgi:RNA polymerase sigma-54 factor|nr:RNA polymerase factor sigma-54 [Accumulibacter sp.]
MKPSLQIKLSQHLSLTPQLAQSIKLLQLSTLELEQELEKYLLENPLLEREDETSSPGVAPEGAAAPQNADETPGEAEPMASGDEESWLGEPEGEAGYSGAPGSFDDEENDYQDVQVAATSLREHLMRQLGLMGLPERDRSLVQCLIDALNDDGYLTQSLEELAESLPRELAIDPRELRVALRHLQNFEPTGVGARSVRECLELQLEARPADETRDLALKIVREHLELLAARDFTRLKKLAECDDDALRRAQLLIRSLDPRPGAKYAALDVRYITPDVVVRKVRGQWTASINADVYPRLRINRLYAQILSRNRGSTLAGHLQEARWLIKNVQQRFDTILRVAQAIVDCQRQFFDHGELAMRPLVLREIAEMLGLHESTVSRVTTQKYMATPRGIFEMKYFFGSHVTTEAGGACSATAIQALIKQLVAAEDAKKPISDSQIAELLSRQGIVVARRTVAKYRESLGIPPVKLRKTF